MAEDVLVAARTAVDNVQTAGLEHEAKAITTALDAYEQVAAALFEQVVQNETIVMNAAMGRVEETYKREQDQRDTEQVFDSYGRELAAVRDELERTRARYAGWREQAARAVEALCPDPSTEHVGEHCDYRHAAAQVRAAPFPAHDHPEAGDG